MEIKGLALVNNKGQLQGGAEVLFPNSENGRYAIWKESMVGWDEKLLKEYGYRIVPCTIRFDVRKQDTIIDMSKLSVNTKV